MGVIVSYRSSSAISQSFQKSSTTSSSRDNCLTMATAGELHAVHGLSEEGSDTKPNAEDYESKHVHEVYQQIASHFSETRYKVCLRYSDTISTIRPNNKASHGQLSNGSFSSRDPAQSALISAAAMGNI